MKLIEHPHVLGLYDVYENRKYLLVEICYLSCLFFITLVLLLTHMHCFTMRNKE